MHFSVEVREWTQGVLSVIKALPARPTMAVLEGIYMEAKDGGVTLKCSDNRMQKECTLSASVEEEGACVVKGRLLSELLRKLPDTAADVCLSGNTLHIHCGRAYNQLQCIEYDEFPSMPFQGETFDLRIDHTVLKDLIGATAFAAAQDDGRPVLTGALLQLGGDCMTLVATDSYQFAMNTVHLPMQFAQRRVIIPVRSLLEIAHMMDETDEEVILSFTNTHVMADIGSARLTARLLDGNYIDYERILPKEQKTRALVDRQELMNTIDRAQLVSREGNNSIIMKFSDNKLQLRAESYIGKCEDELEIQLTGDDIEIAFNPRFCINILKCISDEKIYLDFILPINPCVIRPAQGDAYYYLIVPMRVF